MPCDYPGCRATRFCTTTDYRPRKHPRLCVEHMRLLSEAIYYDQVPRAKIPGYVKRWWVTHCRPKKEGRRA